MTRTGEVAITQLATGVRIAIKVIPRAPRNTIDGIRDGRLVVRVTAPPVDRAANDAVVAFLAEALSLPRRAIRISAGERSRNKMLEISGATIDNVIALLGFQ